MQNPVSPELPSEECPAPDVPGKEDEHERDLVCKPCAVVDDEGLDTAQRPKDIADVYIPTKQEIARHNLTHMPYRSWCQICVTCAKNNAHHRSLPAHSRRLPLLCLDCCFLRDSQDRTLLTVCVARLYPYRAIATIVCEAKGGNHFAVNRLAAFISACGVERLVYKCDQESALNTMIKNSLSVLGKEGWFAGGVPENPAVGESQSNGLAEKAVQDAETRIRVLKHALQDRIQKRVPSTHPVMKWLTQYAGVLLTKYHVHDDNTTADQQLHGKRAS